ncbi:unnamed protein product, partial [Prorocentrum cordatum]
CQLCNRPSLAAWGCYWRDKGEQGGGGKGTGESFGKDGKGKGKDSATFTGKCDFCHKPGHEKEEGADFEREICDDDQLYCMAMKAEDSDAEFRGMGLDGATFIALDTASDCHVGPIAFGEGCKQVADTGLGLLGAQRQEITMGAVATAPMAVDDDNEQTKLLKAGFRLGHTVSTPILSLLEEMDMGAEFWLGAKTGVCMCPGGDLTRGIPLTRKNNTLGFNARTFRATTEAKEFAASVSANEQQEELVQSPGASGSGVLREGREIVLHLDSRVEDLRARLEELWQPIYGRKDDLRTRLSDAERRLTAHRARMKELERRREVSVQGGLSIAPLEVAGPAAPAEAERAARELLHLTRAPWCEACVRGKETTKARKTLTFDQKDTGEAQITLDFCYLNTNGDWAEIGSEGPPAAHIFATTLVMADGVALMFVAASMPTMAVTDYAVASVSSFLEGMHLAAADIKTDGEPTILAAVEEVRKKVSKSIQLEEKRGNLKDSQSMGAIEAPIIWFQAKVRTYMSDLGKRCGMEITAGAPIWCWLARYVSPATSTYRPRADRRASHQGTFGVTYNGDVLPFAETVLSRTCGRLEPALRADAKLTKVVEALPWEARSAESCELLPMMQRPLPTIVLTAAEQKAKAEAEVAAAPAAPRQGAPNQGAHAAARSAAAPPWAPAGPGGEPAAAAGPQEESAMEKGAPMTPRGQVRPADGEEFGLPGMRARHVDAISLHDFIDNSILDKVGTASYMATCGLEPAVGLKGGRGAWEVLARCGARGDIPWSESGLFKMIEVRGPGLQVDGSEGDAFAASSSAQTSRLVDFVSVKEESHGTFIADRVEACCQAGQTEKVCVEPPPQCLAILAAMGGFTDIVWALDKMLPGQRVAGAGWVDKAAKTLEGEGFERCECQPQFYRRKEKDIRIEVHMGDLHGEGQIWDLGGIIERLRGMFGLRATGVIGQGRYFHLERGRLRLVDGDVMLGPNVEHIEDLILVAEFRTGVGIYLYNSPDRADIQRGVQLLARNLSKPTEFDRDRLVKLARYQRGAKTYGALLKGPAASKPGEVKLHMFTDTGFAACKETRRAMARGVTKLDGVHFAAFARRQGVQTTSSGESEFYRAASVVMGGRLVKDALRWLGYKVTWELGVDSSAAKAMINREGFGKVKHLDVGALWVQQERKVRGLIVKKESGENNVADLGAKAHPVARFECLRGLAGIVDCSEMDKHKELEACSVATRGRGECDGVDVRSGELRAEGHTTDLVAAAIQGTIYECTGHIMTLVMVVVFLGGVARGYCCRKLMGPPGAKYTDKPMKICEEGNSAPVASGKAK